MYLLGLIMPKCQLTFHQVYLQCNECISLDKDLAFDIDSPLLDLNLLYPGITEITQEYVCQVQLNIGTVVLEKIQ